MYYIKRETDTETVNRRGVRNVDDMNLHRPREGNGYEAFWVRLAWLFSVFSLVIVEL